MDSQSVANLIRSIALPNSTSFSHQRKSHFYEGQAPLLGYPRTGIAPQTLEKLTPVAIVGITRAITGVLGIIQFRGSSCTNCHYLRPFTDAVVI